MKRVLGCLGGVLLMISGGCPRQTEEPRDFRQDMREFVQAISAYGKARASTFLVIPQNGQELLTTDGEPDGPVAAAYVGAIDGVGREDLFYGFTEDNVTTPSDESEYMLGFLALALAYEVRPLVSDYCWDHAKMDDSYTANHGRGFLGFAADHRELDHIPAYPDAPYMMHDGDVRALSDARNFLYLINPDTFASKEAYLAALQDTDYDILLIDLFFGPEALTEAEVTALKTKANGGVRLVIAYMSIGEAEDYRYYWQSGWAVNPPSWLAGENPNWEGNYKVRYWDPTWQAIIMGSENAYLDRILAAGFDGAYLDIIDAFEYFVNVKK